MADAPYLQFENITKSFPGVKALQNVSFGVAEGSVHALLGENGAGKSTLLKTLSGAHLPTSGNLRIGGESVIFRSTSEAMAAGVAVIYQELHLVPQVSVAENLFIGHLPNSGGVIHKKKLREMARAQLERFGEAIDPDMLVSRLPIGQRQMIEIAKALSRGAKIIAFDEPTSSLSAREISRLFEVIRSLQKQNCAILYVTHRMEEVYRICDSATVLRDGKHVVSWNSMKEATQDVVVKAMVGRDLQDIYNYHPRAQGEVALEVSNLAGPGIKKPVSLSVKKGEILGLFGLIGAGRTELLKLIYGAAHRTSGEVRVNGESIGGEGRGGGSPRNSIRNGVMLCPEDRKGEGIIPIRSVMENINISARRNSARMKFIVNEQWERTNARHHIQSLSIRTPSAKQLIRNLSGGNQQKAILARWLSEEMRVILLDEPTRGIDVGAKSEIYSIIYQLAERGIAVIVVSSDLPEVLGVCDRVMVMREGEIAANLSRAEATPELTLAQALPVTTASAATS